MSRPIFCPGSSGKSTGCNGTGAVFAVLSLSWYGRQFKITFWTNKSIFGHHYSSRNLCLILTNPWWVSWARFSRIEWREAGTTKRCSPRMVSPLCSLWIKKNDNRAGSFLTLHFSQEHAVIPRLWQISGKMYCTKKLIRGTNKEKVSRVGLEHQQWLQCELYLARSHLLRSHDPESWENSGWMCNSACLVSGQHLSTSE